MQLIAVWSDVNAVSQNGAASHGQSDSIANNFYHATSAVSSAITSRNNDVLVSTSAALSMDYEAETSPSVWHTSDQLAVNADSVVSDQPSSRPPNPCPRISSSVSSPSPGAPARFSAHQTFSSSVVGRTAFPFDASVVPTTDSLSTTGVVDSSESSIAVAMNSVCTPNSPLAGH